VSITFSQFRNRVTFQENDETPDAGGWKQAEDWQSIATDPTVWCSVVPITADESFTADADIPSVTHRIFLRNRDDLNTGKTRGKITLRGVERFFYIKGQRHIPDEMDDWLELKVDEEPVE